MTNPKPVPPPPKIDSSNPMNRPNQAPDNAPAPAARG